MKEEAVAVALTWATSFSDHLQTPGATHASGERASLKSPTFCCCSLENPSLSLSPYFLSILCPLFSICLAGTTECPWRAGMEQKESLRENSDCKSFM